MGLILLTLSAVREFQAYSSVSRDDGQEDESSRVQNTPEESPQLYLQTRTSACRGGMQEQTIQKKACTEGPAVTNG